MNIRSFEEADREGLIFLWSELMPATAPHHDPSRSLDLKLGTGRDLLLVACIDDAVVGAVMGGWDGHRGWVYSLAVRPGQQRLGIGSALMRELEQRLSDRGCPKINLQVLPENAEVAAFYEQLGFTVETRLSMGKRLYD